MSGIKFEVRLSIWSALVAVVAGALFSVWQTSDLLQMCLLGGIAVALASFGANCLRRTPEDRIMFISPGTRAFGVICVLCGIALLSLAISNFLFKK